MSPDVIEGAADRAGAALREAGEYTGQTLSRVTAAAQKDLAGTALHYR